MPRLGDNISPYKYTNQTQQTLTRFELFYEIYRVLLAMGFSSVYAYNRRLRHVPIDALDPDTDRLTANLNNFGNFEYIAVLDYPDTYTVAVAGETLRPCLVLAMGYSSIAGVQDLGYTFGMHHMARKDVADPNAEIFTADGNVGTLLHGIPQTKGATSNMYMGGHNAIATNEFFEDAPGLFTSTQFWGNNTFSWKAHPSDDYNEDTTSTAAHRELMPTGNIQIVLSGGGLLIQVGSGAKKTQLNDYINFLVVFGGERFPGRGLPEAEDSDRANTNSSYELTLNDVGEVSDSYYSNTTANRQAPNGILIGGQFTDPITGTVLAQADSIKCRTMNFNNVDLVFENSRFHMGTYNSPRTLDGTGYHILSPWIYVLEEQTADNSLYAPGSAGATFSWRWQDVYYAPGLVLADTVAPAGEYVDVNTNRTYHMFYTQRFGEMLGIDVTGATQLTPASIPGMLPTHTLVDETVYDMSSGAVVIDTGSVAVTEGAKDAGWTIGNGAVDELKTTVWTSTDETILELDFEVAGDPDDYAYELLWDCTNYGDATTGPGVTTIHPRMNNAVFVGYKSGETGGENLGTSYFPTAFGGLENAGAATPAAETISSWVPRNITSKKLEIAFLSEYTAGAANKTVTISNIRLRRWQLQ